MGSGSKPCSNFRVRRVGLPGLMMPATHSTVFRYETRARSCHITSLPQSFVGRAVQTNRTFAPGIEDGLPSAQWIRIVNLGCNICSRSVQALPETH